MKLANVLATLKEAEPLLRSHGVLHAAVFGSVARGEETADSDVDILLDFDPTLSKGVWAFVEAQRAVSDLFEIPIDVVEREALRPNFRMRVEREQVHAF